MKWASSIYYGGEIIDASDCDREDYKRLGLLCPECKDPVLLKMGSERTSSKGNIYNVESHFAHFPGKDAALVARCEKRVSQYSPRELAKRAAQTRGQRLKILQRWFSSILADKCGAIFCDNPWVTTNIRGAEHLIYFSDLCFMDEGGKGWHQDMLAQFFVDRKDWLKFYIEAIYRNCVTGSSALAIYGDYDYGDGITHDSLASLGFERTQQFFDRLSGVDKKLHFLICSEIIDYLATPKAYPILCQLTRTLLMDYIFSFGEMFSQVAFPEITFKILINPAPCIHAPRYGFCSDFLDRIKLIVGQLIVLLIILGTPWANEFARFDKQQQKQKIQYSS